MLEESSCAKSRPRATFLALISCRSCAALNLPIVPLRKERIKREDAATQVLGSVSPSGPPQTALRTRSKTFRTSSKFLWVLRVLCGSSLSSLAWNAAPFVTKRSIYENLR
jgi:hypothetical protein